MLAWCRNMIAEDDVATLFNLGLDIVHYLLDVVYVARVFRDDDAQLV